MAFDQEVELRKARIALCLSLAGVVAVAPRAAGGFEGFDPEMCMSRGPSRCDGRATDTPVVTALRVPDGEVALDGRLDEPFWAEAEAAFGFSTWDPSRGEPPSEQTVFKAVYDDEAIYFGVSCLHENGSRMSSRLCRRDALSSCDIVSLYLDTYMDRTTGYNFRVNPDGVLGDRHVSDDGGVMDPDWDAVWDAATYVDEDGWYAEFEIPFSCVRYRPGENMEWGCQLYRFMYELGEDTSWATWSRDKSGFVSRFGRLAGISGIPAPRQFELLPYAVTRTTDPAAVGDDDELDQYQNVGLDLSYGVTADLVVNAAFQPDFGQVEADPSLLNLSPFETYYDEKRPFFIEGSGYFSHPDFNVFYSRRIGTGDELSRIRAAGKLTGKTPSGYSVAALYALTDVAAEGRAHQFWNDGEQTTQYVVGKLGKEFSGGDHSVSVMQTAVLRSADRDSLGDYLSRDAYTSSADFDLYFRDRTLNVQGSVVGSVVDPARSEDDSDASHAPVYGSGGALGLRKLGGTFIGGVWGRWETDKLDLNDVGFLSAPDEVSAGAWFSYQHHPDNGAGPFREGNAEISFSRSWFYADAAGYDRDTGEKVWSYGRGRPQSLDVSLSSYCGLRNFWGFWLGGGGDFEGVYKYETRTFEGERGPPMKDPNSFWMWWGVGSDWRKRYHAELEGNYSRNEYGGEAYEADLYNRVTVSDAVTVTFSLGYDWYHADAQHIENFQNTGGGIGGVSYVFAEMDRRTLDATLRADVLFTRDLSLQLYAQPYLTVGEFSNPRELMTPASYDFEPVKGIPDFDPEAVSDYDFKYGAVNVNAVLRWEYAPGSTFYLVWKQGREIGSSGSDSGFSADLHARDILDTEPTNVFLAKVTYWLPI